MHNSTKSTSSTCNDPMRAISGPFKTLSKKKIPRFTWGVGASLQPDFFRPPPFFMLPPLVILEPPFSKSRSATGVVIRD